MRWMEYSLKHRVESAKWPSEESGRLLIEKLSPGEDDKYCNCILTVKHGNVRTKNIIEIFRRKKTLAFTWEVNV